MGMTTVNQMRMHFDLRNPDFVAGSDVINILRGTPVENFPVLRVNRFRSPRWLCNLMVKQQRIELPVRCELSVPVQACRKELRLLSQNLGFLPVIDRQLRHIAKLRKQGNTDEALRLFKELVGKGDASAAVHLEYGYLLDGLSREGQAIVQYTKALALGLAPTTG